MTSRNKMGVWRGALIKALIRPFSQWQARRYLASGGRSMVSLQGRDVCVVSVRGARSGKVRNVPLMYVPYQDGVLLVASLGGSPKPPAWYHNLVANPDITVQVRERRLALRARIASAEEKARLWPLCVEYYPDYQMYQDRCSRDIPVFVCEPRDTVNEAVPT